MSHTLPENASLAPGSRPDFVASAEPLSSQAEADTKAMSPEPLRLESIESGLLVLRGQRVILDADLAALYGVPTKSLNQAAKRRAELFPDDFRSQLNWSEYKQVIDLRSQFVTLKQGQHKKYLPFAYTEHGAIQAANVLRSARAAQMSVHVVRAFVRMRQAIAEHQALAAKLEELEGRMGEHDDQIAALIEAIRRLMEPPGPEHDRRIGFHRGNR